MWQSMIPMRAPTDKHDWRVWCVNVADTRFTAPWPGVISFLTGRERQMFHIQFRDEHFENTLEVSIPAWRVGGCKTSAELIKLLETEVAIARVREAI